MTTEPSYEQQGEQRVVSMTGYRGDCWCGWFGALRGVPLAAEMDIAKHVADRHAPVGNAQEIEYTDDPTEGFDACPEPTCSLYGKAVMADHRHLRPSHSADVPCRFCGAPQSECDMVWLMRDDNDRGCCDACNTRHEEKS